MRDEAQERLELLSAIQDLGYESLRYSIFNEYGPGEWEVVIEFDDSKQVYNVYATMDRASYNKKLEFDNFEDAKNKFIEKLDLTIEINKLFVENGEVPEYSSPLWDKIEADIENMKCIVEQEIEKRHYESLHYVLFDETKQLPWAFHLYQKNGKFYVDGRDDRSYIVGHSKEYDNFGSAKKDFFEKLELVIESNKLHIQLGLSPEYPSPLWDEKEDPQKLRDEAKERLELISTIQDLGYESLRYSIFNEHRPSEWETRIEYNPELELYEVYSTMDRASIEGIFKFKTFEEAKEKFIHNLKLTVFINKTSVENGEVPEYSSPLWEKIDD